GSTDAGADDEPKFLGLPRSPAAKARHRQLRAPPRAPRPTRPSSCASAWSYRYRTQVCIDRPSDPSKDRLGLVSLVESGISEPGMMCGAGKNLGAYAALMTAIEYPRAFQLRRQHWGITDPPWPANEMAPRDRGQHGTRASLAHSPR